MALDGFRAQPLRGEGAGSFAGRWERSRSVELPMRDAHSLVLGTMTELGAVGLSLLAVFLASVAVAARRTRRRRGGLRRSTGAAAAAAIATWLVHAGLDWDWEMPALTGCARGPLRDAVRAIHRSDAIPAARPCRGRGHLA